MKSTFRIKVGWGKSASNQAIITALTRTQHKDATTKEHSCIQSDSIYLYLYGVCKHGACVSGHVVADDLILYWWEQVLDNLPLPTFMILR